jgi:uncharacterized repeat protein (TIGR02543 family)
MNKELFCELEDLKLKKLSELISIIIIIFTVSACTSTFEITIKFDSNGGTPVSSISTNGQDTIRLPENPTKEGYFFSGWYWDNNTFRDLFNLASLTQRGLTSDLTVYAKWDLDDNYIPIGSVKVIFDSKGGTVVSPVYVMPGKTILIPEVSKIGHTLDGWYTSVNNGATFDERWSFTNNVVNNDINLYAKWIVNTYSISFNSKGGTILESITGNFNSFIELPINPTKQGYTFDGWFKDENFLEKFNLFNFPAENLILYAKWIINSFTITFDSNGGTEVESITQEYNTEVEEPNAPTREGYRFEGWYSDSLLTNAYTFTSISAQNLELYAKWMIITYTITYELNEGTNHINNPITFNVNSNVNLESPTRTGYNFEGWYESGDFSGNTIMGIPLGTTKDIIIYAKWIINSYTITFDSNGGTEVESITQEYNTEVEEPNAPTREGYQFEGWNIEIPLLMPDEDLIIIAIWKNDGKLYIDGYMTNGINSWNNSTVSYISDGAEMILSSENEELKVEVIAGVLFFTPRFGQMNIPFEYGKTYEISFDAKSSEEKEIVLQVGELLQTNPWYNDFLPQGQNLIYQTIKTEWATYSFNFTMTQNNYNGGILFNLGKVNNNSVNATMYFDNIIIKESDYYLMIDGVKDSDLLLTLRSITSTYIYQSYDEARYILQISDKDPNNINNIILIYNRASVKGRWDSGSTWNREHVWPQSLLENNYQKADTHNLKPVNPSINSSRGNDTYASGTGTYRKVMGGWYPGDQDKGDIARIILYMHLRYGLNISLVGNLNILLKWHEEDPVDAFELNRNQVIYSYQKNRNPFIDHPDLVHRIFGEPTFYTSYQIEVYQLLLQIQTDVYFEKYMIV